MADDNPYDDIVSVDAAQALRQSMDQAVDVKPDRESEIKRLGKLYGLPTTTVRSLEPQVRRRAEVDAFDYDAIVRQTPATAAYLSNPENAKVARDDLDTLSSMENITRGIGERAGKLAGGLGRFSLTLADPLADPVADFFEKRGVPSIVEWGPDGIRLRNRTAAERESHIGGDTVTAAAEALKLGYQPQTTWEDFKASPLKNFFPFAIEQGLVSVPDMAAVIVNLPAYVAARSGEIGQTRAVNDERKEATVQDFIVSAPTAVASALLERLGTKGILGLDDAARAFKEVPGAVGKAAVKEGATEAGQEAVESVGETAGTEKGFNLAETGERALAGAVGGVGFGGPVRAATASTQVLEGVLNRAADNVAKAMDATAMAEGLSEMDKTAAASKLRERDPQSFQEFVEAATADGPVPDVYVSAQGLAQSGVNVEELAALVPSVASQLTDAVASGGDIRIPVSEFATFMAGTDMASSLIPFLRTTPGGFSQTEAKQFMEAQGDALQAEVEGVMATAIDKEAFAASTESVKSYFNDQLNEAARFSPDVNNAYASMMSSFYAVNAGRLGITPEEMLTRYPLQVRAEGVLGGAGALDQSAPDTPEFREWFGNSVVREPRTSSRQRLEDMPPVRVYHGTRAQFDEFTPSRKGWASTTFTEPKLVDRHGIFFAENKAFAETFANVPGEGSPRTIEAYLKLENPLDLSEGLTPEIITELTNAGWTDAEGWRHMKATDLWQAFDEAPGAELVAAMQTAGYDGAILVEEGIGLEGEPTQYAWVAFDPAQVRQVQSAEALDQLTRGQFTPANSTITLLKNADLSTFLHEAGHFYLETLADMAAQPDAPAEVQADMDAVLKWFGGMKAPKTSGSGPLNQSAPDTPEFREWFGESQVVDEAGQPQVVYHGTSENVEAFKLPSGRGNSRMSGGRAIYVAVEPKTANGFARYEGANVSPLYASVENPFDFSNENHLAKLEKYVRANFNKVAPGALYGPDSAMSFIRSGDFGLLEQPAVMAWMKKQGHDGFWITERDGERTLGLWDPTKLKSAIGNKGTFDPNDPSILNQNGEEGAPSDGPMTLERWQSMTLNEQRFYHEAFARGFEAYLFEGKAPSSALRALFQRFSAWLRHIYRDITRLKVELSDDVRSVFDRMLASAEAIQQQEAANNLGPMFQSAEEAGMDELEWENYKAEATEAMADAMGEMQTRSLRDMKWLSNAKDKAIRRLQREAADQRKAVKAEVTAEVMAEPVNQARQFLRRGTGKDGQQVEGPHKLSLPAMREMFEGVPAELQDWQKLGYGRYGMLAEEGLLPDMVAGDYGYASGEALVEALLNAEPAAEKIAGMTDQRMLERFGDLADEDAIERAADVALHNDARLRFVATEANALAKATGRPRILAKAAKDFAQGMIGRLRVKDVKPNRFRAAETRAAIAAEKARKKGDLVTATVEKRNQLINGHATRAAYETIAEMEKALITFRRIVAGKDEALARNRDMDLVNAARSILSAYGIGRAKNDPTGYVETIKRVDPVLYADLEPFLANATVNAKDWREITVDEFTGLRDTVGQLWYLSKRNRQMEIDGELVDRKLVAEELSARLDDLGVPDTTPGSTQAVTDTERALRTLSGYRAATRRVESWTRNMDGADSGPFRKYIWNLISEPGDVYRNERNAYIKRFLDIVSAVEGGLKPYKLAAPEIGYTFSGKSELLHAILHTGNESNKRKLLLGRRWASENADGTLDTSRWDAFVTRMQAEGRLTKSDYDFAQATWDLLEETKEGAQRAHRTVYGRYFEEITAEAFDTPYGSYKGGYVPALTDSFLVQDAAQRADQEAITEGDANMFPSPAKGFTKSRVDYNRELALDLRLIPQHIDKVLKFTHFAPPTREAVRLLKEKGFSAKLNAYDPVAQTDLLLPWLNRAAKQIVDTPWTGTAGRGAARVARAIRQRAGLGIMFANISNALQQVTGFAISAVRVKPRLLAAAYWEYLQDPSGVTERIRAVSPFMAQRTDSQAFQNRQMLDDLILSPGKFQKTQEFFTRHGYFLQTAFQNNVDIATWLGAYNQATEAGASDKEAIRVANSTVRETQGSLNPEDVSRYETGSPFWRLFTQFQGFFNNQANLLGTEFNLAVRDLGLRKGAGRMLYVYMLGFMAPAVLSEAIVTAMRGGIDDEDDDGYLDDILAKFWGSQGRFALAMVPIAGPMAAAVFNAANDKPYDDRLTTPAITTIENASRAPAEVYKAILEDGDQSKALKDTLSLMTLLTGIPFNAAARPLGYLADVAEGDVTPTGPVDFARGLVTGTASPASRE